MRPCSRCTRRTTATSRPASTRSTYGSVYSPPAGSSRCEPATWQSPSRSATSPPSEPTLDDASVTPGSTARSSEAARSSTRSCEPTATIVRSIAPTPRSSVTSTDSPAWWPSNPAGTTSRPSARTSDVSTPAPRGSGVATSSPPTRPSRTRTQSSMPIDDAYLRARRAWARGRRVLAGGGGRGRGALGRGRALERREGRRGEDVERQRGGDGVAGSAEHGRGVDGAEDDGMPRPHRHAVDGQGAEPFDDRRRVVVAAGARAGDDDDDVGPRGRVPDGRGDRLGVVRDDLGAPRVAACRLGLGDEHERVRVEDDARGGRGADGADLV